MSAGYPRPFGGDIPLTIALLVDKTSTVQADSFAVY
jgi:hypothetical protein